MPIYTITAGADISLTSATPKTAVSYIAASTRRPRLRGFRVSGSSVTQTDAPILVEIITGNTTQGTFTAATARPVDLAEPAALGTAGANHTVEPSAGTAITHFQERLSPIGGLIIYDFPPEQRPVAAVSSCITLRLTSQSSLTNVRGEIVIDE